MNECIGHVIGKPHSPVTGLYLVRTGYTSCDEQTVLGLMLFIIIKDVF